MPRRTVWAAGGVVVGAGATLWAERKVRRAVEQAAARLEPDALVADVSRAARQAVTASGARVRDAVRSGRDEMRRRQDELWDELAPRGAARPAGTAPLPGPGGPGTTSDGPGGGGARTPDGHGRRRVGRTARRRSTVHRDR